MEPDLLRFITCGSVDDGKSTLIGRLLHETRLILDDQAATLARDSRRHGTTGDEVDYALLVDGLQAEREQGITIDVAYRFITTPRRRFIVADTPGHEQYTRNMATGASTADLAILLVDARHGLVTQTRRHSLIVSLLGIRQIVLAVNKIDLVGFDPAVFERIVAEYAQFSAGLGFDAVTAIPLSARYGDNVVARSVRTPWYVGLALLEHLETVQPASQVAQPFRMPVQLVSRPDSEFRGYSGTVAAGGVRVGERVAATAGSSAVARILVAGVEAEAAETGQAVTIALVEPLDISRGDVLTADNAPLERSDQFQARLVWVDARPLSAGRTYWFQIGTALVPGSVTRIRHRIAVNTQEKVSATELAMNDIAVVNVSLQSPVAFAPFAENRMLGGFIIIDRETNATAAAGMIEFALTRAANLTWQPTVIDKAARARLKQQTPVVVWFTGLSGAGKSAIANLVEQKLYARGLHSTLLDGDNVRHGLNRDLGFTPADRVENIRRVAEVATLFLDAGLIVLCCFISPYRAERQMARELVGDGEFIEVFVDTPVEECRRRDVKGLYAKADAGLIRNFTGVSAPYEAPEQPELVLHTSTASADALADQVVARLLGGG
ncbi:adenylyl-sulfate kinase [Acidisphaera sp. L21]|uniref:adenylyl-sulfate kinase n=1 Tax=Acidisphaera sp. L21 TaxID=1641851 RepID=UPI00131E7641|nr:adenylyl-sulfate kinase [Acidisphaera sp. L21]